MVRGTHQIILGSVYIERLQDISSGSFIEANPGAGKVKCMKQSHEEHEALNYDLSEL